MLLLWETKRWNREECNLLKFLWCEAVSQAPARVGVHGTLRESSDSMRLRRC
jgi:hypothetical protein